MSVVLEPCYWWILCIDYFSVGSIFETLVQDIVGVAMVHNNYTLVADLVLGREFPRLIGVNFTGVFDPHMNFMWSIWWQVDVYLRCLGGWNWLGLGWTDTLAFSSCAPWLFHPLVGNLFWHYHNLDLTMLCNFPFWLPSTMYILQGSPHRHVNTWILSINLVDIMHCCRAAYLVQNLGLWLENLMLACPTVIFIYSDG